MSEHKQQFDNLLKVGQLKKEAFIETEFIGLVLSANRKLHDAKNHDLSIDSRFDLAYNAAHSLSLAALRKAGYRSENRYIVFQLLEATVGMPATVWRVLSTAHQKRNLAEYEGFTEIETSLLDALIDATEKLNATLKGKV